MVNYLCWKEFETFLEISGENLDSGDRENTEYADDRIFVLFDVRIMLITSHNWGEVVSFGVM